ncbi:hypothetical protein K788_0000139 [Paraburkholderia caribensis MBA4]|uniref:Uncharacterized protein n=1 Tax=Paraburkholderia caribensis MBA4 TaxID=1323664 RepID=A0A0P0RJJ7_9BURK|nr:hypothetical protein [Paraburkholderia caribensis]ALL68851.1 hypothetical protein K788_0000139 [Paraburkholderia caribensis MBA4]
MDIIDLARESGLTVILDGRIGREEYHSVCGSISALSRFAESVYQRAANPDDCVARQSSATGASGQSRRATQRSPQSEASRVDGMSRTSVN